MCGMGARQCLMFKCAPDGPDALLGSKYTLTTEFNGSPETQAWFSLGKVPGTLAVERNLLFFFIFSKCNGLVKGFSRRQRGIDFFTKFDMFSKSC